MNQKPGEDPELTRRVRREKSEFIVYDGPEFT
jgi:hypothetical protein